MKLKAIILCAMLICGNLWAVKSPYEILGISDQSNEQQVKKAYKRLALKYHPDRIDASSSEAEIQKMKARILEINTAYEDIMNQLKPKNTANTAREEHYSEDIFEFDRESLRNAFYNILQNKGINGAIVIEILQQAKITNNERVYFRELSASLDLITRENKMKAENVFSQILPSGFYSSIWTKLDINARLQMLRFLSTYYTYYPSTEGLVFIHQVKARFEAVNSGLAKDSLSHDSVISRVNGIISLIESEIDPPKNFHLNKMAYKCKAVFANMLFPSFK